MTDVTVFLYVKNYLRFQSNNMTFDEKRSDDIAWNSALNNAVNMVSVTQELIGKVFRGEANETAKMMIEDWQLWFYKNLTERKTPEPKKIPMTGKEVAMLSKTMEDPKVGKHFDVRDHND